MEHEAGGGAFITGVHPLRQGTYTYFLVVKLLGGYKALREVPCQAVNPRDHYRVPRSERLAKFLP